MNADAITLRLAATRDARAIAEMSRDLVESGLGWKYDAGRVLRAIDDRDTVTLVANDTGRRATDPLAGFAIISRKFDNRRLPSRVRIDSGWNCTPTSGNCRCASPMITPSGVRALTTNVALSRLSGSTTSEW